MTITINEGAHGDDHHWPAAKGGPAGNPPGVVGWTVAIGGVNEGFTLYGDFKTAEEADEWAKNEPFAPYYMLAPLMEAFVAK